LIWIPCDQCSSTRDIRRGFPHRIDYAKHHVINLRGIEFVTSLDGAKRLACQIKSGHFMQRAVHFAAPARRADVIVDKGVGH
jgi:hypothetical protein